MTHERLLEAIGAFDPDGYGMSRVRDAAAAYLLSQSCTRGCLLAIAWSTGDSPINVGSSTFVRNGTHVQHDCEDVVHWFDRLTPGPLANYQDRQVFANQTMLQMLSEDGTVAHPATLPWDTF